MVETSNGLAMLVDALKQYLQPGRLQNTFADFLEKKMPSTFENEKSRKCGLRNCTSKFSCRGDTEEQVLH